MRDIVMIWLWNPCKSVHPFVLTTVWCLAFNFFIKAVRFTFSSGRPHFVCFKTWRKREEMLQAFSNEVFCSSGCEPYSDAVFIKLLCSFVDNMVLKLTLFNVFNCSWCHCAGLISKHLSFQHYTIIVLCYSLFSFDALRYSAHVCISYPLQSQFSAVSFYFNLSKYPCFCLACKSVIQVRNKWRDAVPYVTSIRVSIAMTIENITAILYCWK